MKMRMLDLKADRALVEAIWRELSQTPGISYFVSWGWIETWIDCMPPDAQVNLAVGYEGDLPVLAFFVGRANVVRHGAIYSRSLFLNATGIPEVDKIWIEYNSMLYRKGANYTLQQVLDSLPYKWDECVLPGMDVSLFPGSLLSQGQPYGDSSARLVIERDVPSPYVDLELVRANGGDYIALLACKSTRGHLRRSQRLYELRGPLLLEVAHNQHKAQEIFEEMVLLHQERREQKGESSNFAAGFPHDFHRELIRRRLDSGEIQLLRVSAGHKTIGCIYNFVFGGTVYHYQSGYHYEEGHDAKPGYTTIVEAVKYNAAVGNVRFDLLGSNARYKAELCTNSNRLVWATLQKSRIQFHIEQKLKSLKHRFQPSPASAAHP